MFNSSPLIYCNCVSVPVLPCSSVYSPWNCPVPTPTPGYGASLHGMATHRALGSEQRENTGELSTSRRLKFGIENILYGTSSQPAMPAYDRLNPYCPSEENIFGNVGDRHEVHNRYSCNQNLSFITRQSFPPHLRTSTRPWCRPVFTQLQRQGLEKRFQAAKYVTKRERLQIGAMLGLSETQVKVWFQNRRTKWRHEAAKKEEKQEKQSLQKTNVSNQKEEFENPNDKVEGKEDVCSPKWEESIVDESK